MTDSPVVMGVDSPSRNLARDLRYWHENGLPDDVEHQAIRCILNAVGSGIGGSRDTSTRALFTAIRAANGLGETPVLGRLELLPSEGAALVNAYAVTQNDFDDAHFETMLHPSAPTLAAVLSAPSSCRGLEAIRAFALGCEVQLAWASAVSPSHYSRGWHTSARCAAIGSAVTMGLLLGLDDDRLALTIDLALLRAVGLRQSHGTHAKGYQVGRGAANGVAAAGAVAERAPGWGDGLRDVETCRQARHEGFDAVSLREGRWLLPEVVHKPYPVGMVCFGGIEAALDAAQELDPGEIRSIRVEVAALTVELAGNRHPLTEDEARVSLPHGVAAALVRRSVGLDEFSQSSLRDPGIARVREMVEVVPRPDLTGAAASLHVSTDHASRSWEVDEPLGGPDRPLEDDALEEKIASLLSPTPSGRLTAAIWALPDAEDLEQLIALIRSANGAS